METLTQIGNLADLLHYFNADTLPAAERTLRKQMSCDVWLNVGVDKVSISSLVNGDAIECEPLTFPFTVVDLEHAIAWVDDRATELYNEVYDAETSSV